MVRGGVQTELDERLVNDRRGAGPAQRPGEALALWDVQQQAGGVLEVGHHIGRRWPRRSEGPLHAIQPLLGRRGVDRDREDAEAEGKRRIQRIRIGRMLDEQPLPTPQDRLERDRDRMQGPLGDQHLLGCGGQAAPGVALGDAGA